MNFNKKSWPAYHKSLMSLIEKSPIAFLPHSNKRTTNLKLEAVWKDISLKLGLTTRICKLQWSKTKLTYAKIMTLIKTGKVTLDVAMSHPKTRKFFDGRLNFLNPCISNITDEDIPFAIHSSINDIFCLETKHSLQETTIDNSSQFFTHGQVKELLTERLLRGDVVNNIDTEHLLSVVDKVVERKLGELLLMRNGPSYTSNDIANNNDDENTDEIVRKRKPTLILSKNSLNNNEKNTTTTNNLGLQTELILDDDIKIEEEDDDVNMENEDFVNTQEVNFVDLQDEHSVNNQNEDYVDMENENFVNNQNEQYITMKEDFVKEDYSTLAKNINNTTEINYDIEISLPRSQILTVGNDKKNETSKDLCENVVVIEDNTDDRTDTSPVTDEYIRHFFNELGVVMSMELSLDKQKILKSRINDLVRRMLLKEKGQTSEM